MSSITGPKEETHPPSSFRDFWDSLMPMGCDARRPDWSHWEEWGLPLAPPASLPPVLFSALKPVSVLVLLQGKPRQGSALGQMPGSVTSGPRSSKPAGGCLGREHEIPRVAPLPHSPAQVSGSPGHRDVWQKGGVGLRHGGHCVFSRATQGLRPWGSLPTPWAPSKSSFKSL